MNLQQIRAQFVKLSGRYDLASTASTEFDTDGGANFFINAGMKFIDRRYQTHKTLGKTYKKLAAGEWYFTFLNCYAVQQVWCYDTEARWKLRRYPFETIRETYAGLVSAADTGSPKYYSPVWLRGITTTDMLTQGTFFDVVQTSDNGLYNGILFTPATDGEYTLEVIGKFYHAELTTNTDQNFWTNEAPEVLLKAALYQLEIFYRNTEGANDWLKALELEGTELEKNVIDQDSSEEEVIE